MTCIEMQRTEKPKKALPKKNKKFKMVKINLEEVIELVQAEVDKNPDIIHIYNNRAKNHNDK
ncbi:hypothetical protein [Vibrio parahaemolyticus]|uniref:hypothetical protein n=1 Tax=Vibrio parahaemolyticus TaxID=670 RepID=UPI003D9CAB79|nr:hypothetical protein [Vibrio parahaemolyticus]